MLLPGKVLSGKYSGYYITNNDDYGFSIGGVKNIHRDIKSVSVVGSINKADLILSITPVKTYYNVQVTWYSGGESLMEVNGKILNMLNSYANANANWRSMTPAQQADARKKAAEDDKFKEKLIPIIVIAFFGFLGLLVLLGV